MNKFRSPFEWGESFPPGWLPRSGMGHVHPPDYAPSLITRSATYLLRAGAPCTLTRRLPTWSATPCGRALCTTLVCHTALTGSVTRECACAPIYLSALIPLYLSAPDSCLNSMLFALHAIASALRPVHNAACFCHLHFPAVYMLYATASSLVSHTVMSVVALHSVVVACGMSQTWRTFM